MPQGLFLVPCYLISFCATCFGDISETDFATYADGNILYIAGDSINDIINSPEDDSINLFKWFLGNQLRRNSNKCHLITNKQSCMNLKIGNINIENKTCKKLLGVNVHNNST